MIGFLIHLAITAALVLPAYWLGRRARKRQLSSCLPTAPQTASHGVIDQGRLLADLRSGDMRRINEAYRFTFGGQLGRLVLTHWMANCGVGNRQGIGLNSDDRAYIAGRHDAAIELMNTAGFDQPSAVLATLTEQLGDMDHERETPSPGAIGIDPATL